jgi:lysophospholipase L1-like esterase
MTRRQLLGRLALGAGATGLGLAAGELLVRALVPEPIPVRLDELAKEDPNTIKFSDLLVPDPELFWRFRPDLRLPETSEPFFGLISNGQGLRMDHEVQVPRPKGLLRVLCVGDSCTFGYRLGHDQAFPWQLNERLRARFPGKSFEVVNCGVPGWTLFQGWRFLETQAARYAPQLVILNFGWNAGRPWDGMGDWDYWKANRHALPPPALRWSRLAQLAFRARLAPASPASPASKRPRLEPEEFAGLLDWVSTWAREHGAALLLLVGGAPKSLPRPGQSSGARTEYQKTQYEFAQGLPFGPEGGPALVDGAALEEKLYSGGATAREIFLDGVHPTAATNARLADALLEKLAPWVEQQRPD